MITAVLAGLMILLLPWFWRWLVPERDWYMLVICGQATVYGFVAPALTATGESAGVQDGYAVVMWQVALAFGLALHASYFYVRSRTAVNARSESGAISADQFVVDRRRVTLWTAGTIVLALSYLWVALSRGLLFRRLGHTGLAAAQLDLSPLELAPYRLFLQLGPWFVAVLVVVWRCLRDEQRRERTMVLTAIAITGGVFALHAVINSRLTTLLMAAFLAGLFTNSPLTRWLGGPLRKALVAFIVLGGSYYLISVIENIRLELGNDRSIANVQILIPGGVSQTAQQENRSERLDGLGLIVKIRPAVERDGPAMGAAWAIPLVASIDPIFPTELGTRLKAAALTTSKSILLLRYAGEQAEDASSSILTDAYGNLGVSGFVLVGLVLGALLALGTRWINHATSGRTVVVALFMLWLLIPFEQEFGAVLFGWAKLLPVVVVGAWLTPLRARVTAST
ncbi:MAG: hypothetical protein WCL36_06485 [bacterium]